jgi:HSP20 family protein
VVTVFVRTDPFREFGRLTQQALGTMTRPAMMSMDAWRDSVEVVVAFDLPGVEPDSIDIDVERNLLTVKARAASADRRGLRDGGRRASQWPVQPPS